MTERNPPDGTEGGRSVRRLKAGVIGCGAIAQHCHLPGYAKEKRVELAAAADPSPERRKEATEKFGAARTYADWREMLKNEELDVVSVCTPNFLHAEIVCAAADQGCHVFCEKPIAITMEQADRMKEALDRNGVRMMVGFTHRFFAGNRQAKELIESGGIGKPFMIRVRFAHGGPAPGWAMSDWFYDQKKAGGGASLDMGIHAIDLCRFLLAPIDKVAACVRTLIKDIEVDDNAVMVFELGTGALGYIEVGWTSKPGFSGAEVYGTEGSLIIDYRRGLELISGKASAGADSTTDSRIICRNVTEGGWDIEVKHLVDCLLDDTPFIAGYADGRAALAVALAAFEASRKRCSVDLKDYGE